MDFACHVFRLPRGCDRLHGGASPRPVMLVMSMFALAIGAVTSQAVGEDAQSSLPLAPHGTPFHFEVIESQDAKYLGDTPAHMGKDGGLTVRPNVALGDAVYRTDGTTTTVVGRVTLCVWDRVSGSLMVEFDPAPLLRIAVGDEVWIDLNPAPPKPAVPSPTP